MAFLEQDFGRFDWERNTSRPPVDYIPADPWEASTQFCDKLLDKFLDLKLSPRELMSHHLLSQFRNSSFYEAVFNFFSLDRSLIPEAVASFIAMKIRPIWGEAASTLQQELEKICSSTLSRFEMSVRKKILLPGSYLPEAEDSSLGEFEYFITEATKDFNQILRRYSTVIDNAFNHELGEALRGQVPILQPYNNQLFFSLEIPRVLQIQFPEEHAVVEVPLPHHEGEYVPDGSRLLLVEAPTADLVDQIIYDGKYRHILLDWIRNFMVNIQVRKCNLIDKVAEEITADRKPSFLRRPKSR